MEGARSRPTKENDWELNKERFAQFVVIDSLEFEAEKGRREDFVAQARRYKDLLRWC